MDPAKIDEIVDALNNLFSLTSLHVISFEFHKISEEILNHEMLPIEIIPSKHYYLDFTLHTILIKKEKAFKIPDLPQAIAYHKREKELLVLKGVNEQTRLRTMPEISFFEYNNDCIIAHLSKNREIDRLLANLIEYYTMRYKRK